MILRLFLSSLSVYPWIVQDLGSAKKILLCSDGNLVKNSRQPSGPRRWILYKKSSYRALEATGIHDKIPALFSEAN